MGVASVLGMTFASVSEMNDYATASVSAKKEAEVLKISIVLLSKS